MRRSALGAAVGKQWRFDPAATAALLAVGGVAWTAVAWPWTGRSLVDALVNEWIIWFTALYLVLLVMPAAVQVGSRVFTQLQLLRVHVTRGSGGTVPREKTSPFHDVC